MDLGLLLFGVIGMAYVVLEDKLNSVSLESLLSYKYTSSYSSFSDNTLETPNGVTNSMVLKKAGDNPSVCLKKNLFHRYYWHIITCDLIVEDCEEK